MKAEGLRRGRDAPPGWRGKQQVGAKGINLGEEVAHDVVVAHDGTLTITDSPSHGARITITIPAVALTGDRDATVRS